MINLDECRDWHSGNSGPRCDTCDGFLFEAASAFLSLEAIADQMGDAELAIKTREAIDRIRAEATQTYADTPPANE